jgi:diguanylate cyclase (GGDEF)-like protein
MRKTYFASLLIGVVLLSAGPLAIAGASAQERQRDKSLQHDAAQVASAFTSYFERARSLDLLLAQSPAFRPPTDNAGHPMAHMSRASMAHLVHPTLGTANHALVYLERLYPGAFGEACVIDENGMEIARVVQGVPAPMSQLAMTEMGNPFFRPTFALPPGEVYQAAPYVSPDTKHWVISNSTRVDYAGGHSLIVHFEVSLASFAEYLATATPGEHVAVVDATTGRVILQDGVSLPPSDAEFPRFAAADALRDLAPAATELRASGTDYAVSGIERHPGNANDWVVLEWSTASASIVPVSLGFGGTALGAAFIILFVIVLRRQHHALRMAARLDHLTGMANRKALEEALEAALTAAQQDGERVAVLAVDLDDFKQINDTLGHDKGDVVLQEVGRRLHANTFEYDTPARVGGDEFAVVLRHLADDADVAQVAHRLREALVRPIDIDGVSRFVGVSIGVAVHPEHGRAPAEILRSADAAMYKAKRGREGVRVYDVGTVAGAGESWLAAELLVAIESDEITLAFQPEYALDDGRIVGVEALARWMPVNQPPIQPSTFVPLAEQTGLIRSLTHLTLRKALDHVCEWRAADVVVPVSVNLSAKLVTDRSLPSEVRTMLAERRLDGEALVLEITETALIEDFEVASEVLRGLRALGIRIELDDFGSGYASLKALRRMDLDGIKVDRELINDWGQGTQSLLAATVDVGRQLGLYVVAEGIEDESGLEAVRRLGVDAAQGFHLARPMSAEALLVAFADAGLGASASSREH